MENFPLAVDVVVTKFLHSSYAGGTGRDAGLAPMKQHFRAPECGGGAHLDRRYADLQSI
jgi:hypothetical protein